MPTRCPVPLPVDQGSMATNKPPGILMQYFMAMHNVKPMKNQVPTLIMRKTRFHSDDYMAL